MLHRSFVVLVVLLTVRSASGAIIATQDPETVARHAHLVVRGTVDHDSRTVRVLKVYGGAVAPRRLTVVNLRKFGLSAFPAGLRGRAMEGGASCTTHAILFLTEIDQKYWLVETSSPSWVTPHSSIKYVTDKGKILGYHQRMNPGSVSLQPEKVSLAEFEVAIERWLKARPAAPARRKALVGKERTAFWALVTPWMDFATRKVTRTPRPGWELSATLARFMTFIRVYDGEARNRGVEALLILGKRKSPGSLECRAGVESALAALAKNPGRKALEPVLLAELASLDVFAEKSLAGRTLVRLGPESAKAGQKILEGIIATSESSIEYHAYQALRSMGLSEAAEKALLKKRESVTPPK
jgi:hypothetical protein